MKIVYIHGYGSSGNSSSAKKLKEIFPDLLTPTYDPLQPEESLRELISLVSSEDKVIVIGSSLGGWYATRISERIEANLILYNPSTNPEVSLEKYDVSKEIREKYKTIKKSSEILVHNSKICVIFSKDDEVIDYRKSLEYYEKIATEVFFNTGGHRIGSNWPLIVSLVKRMQL